MATRPILTLGALLVLRLTVGCAEPGGDGGFARGGADDDDADGNPDDDDTDGSPDDDDDSPGAFDDSGLFDYRAVHAMGTLAPGQANRHLFAAVDQADRPAIGFPSEMAGQFVVHPDGSLIYVYADNLSGRGQLRRFVPDAWNGVYPPDPAANDPVFPTPACPEEATDLVLDPSGDRWLYECDFDTWYDQDDVLFPCGGTWDEPAAVDDGGYVLCLSPLRVIEPDGDEILTSEIDPGFSAHRARPGGGFLAVSSADTTMGQALFEIRRSGTMEQLHSYADWPEPFRPVNSEVPRWVGLDADGGYYRWTLSEDLVDDILLRFTDEGAEVVYDEGEEPLMQLHAFYLVTGP